jgi:hypothetical protein
VDILAKKALTAFADKESTAHVLDCFDNGILCCGILY